MQHTCGIPRMKEAVDVSVLGRLEKRKSLVHHMSPTQCFSYWLVMYVLLRLARAFRMGGCIPGILGSSSRLSHMYVDM